jgi:hypothetical protein
MRVAGEHLLANMPRNSHDRLVRDLGLGKLGDRVVSQIVETQPREGALNFLNRSLAFPIDASLPRLL